MTDLLVQCVGYADPVAFLIAGVAVRVARSRTFILSRTVLRMIILFYTKSTVLMLNHAVALAKVTSFPSSGLQEMINAMKTL
jgi:hypothetical protein